MSDTNKELLKTWLEIKPQQQKKHVINEIKVINNKLNEDGKENLDFGKVVAINEDGEHFIDISTAQFFPVKLRFQATGRWDDVLERREYWTREVDDYEITVFDGETNEQVAVGNFFNLKKNFNLSSFDIFYVVYNGIIYRWKMIVGGYKIVNKLKKMIYSNNEPHNFKIKNIKAKSNGGIWFNEFEFEQGDKIEIKDAVNYIKEINEFLDAYYKSINEKYEALSPSKEELNSILN